jgi:hypothetical protein
MECGNGGSCRDGCLAGGRRERINGSLRPHRTVSITVRTSMHLLLTASCLSWQWWMWWNARTRPKYMPCLSVCQALFKTMLRNFIDIKGLALYRQAIERDPTTGIADRRNERRERIREIFPGGTEHDPGTRSKPHRHGRKRQRPSGCSGACSRIDETGEVRPLPSS